MFLLDTHMVTNIIIIDCDLLKEREKEPARKTFYLVEEEKATQDR